MPSRTLREGYARSEKVAEMEPAPQDRFPRYFLAADDFGCFRVQPKVIKGDIYSLRDDIDPQRVAADLQEFEKVGCLFTWTADDGKTYGFFTGWWEHNREPRHDSRRKTPVPPHPAALSSAERKTAAEPQRSAAVPQRKSADPQTSAPAVRSSHSHTQSQEQVEKDLSGSLSRDLTPVASEQPALFGQAPEAKAEDAGLNAQIRIVFEHWKKARKKRDDARLSEERKNKIKARLTKDRPVFTVEQLCKAINGIANDPWEGRAREDDIVQVLRDATQVEKFLALADGGKPPAPLRPPAARHGAAVLRISEEAKRDFEVGGRKIL